MWRRTERLPTVKDISVVFDSQRMRDFIAKRKKHLQKTGRYEGLNAPTQFISPFYCHLICPIPFKGPFCPFHKVYPPEAGIQISADSSSCTPWACNQKSGGSQNKRCHVPFMSWLLWWGWPAWGSATMLQDSIQMHHLCLSSQRCPQPTPSAEAQPLTSIIPILLCLQRLLYLSFLPNSTSWNWNSTLFSVYPQL